MNSELFPPTPVDTDKTARAVFGRSNFYLTIGDQANHLFSGLLLEAPAGSVQWPNRTLAVFHLVTIFQYVETLPDLLASDALRKRVDWKYALHLPLNSPFLEASSFCEFRIWLLANQARLQTFQTLLTRLSEVTQDTGVQRFCPEAGQVVATVCRISRLARIWDAMSLCLEALAIKRPDWLRLNNLPHWYGRYSHHPGKLDLGTDCLAQEALAQAVGADGFYLLKTVSNESASGLADLPEVLVLRQVWDEQFEFSEESVLWKKRPCTGGPSPSEWNVPNVRMAHVS